MSPVLENVHTAYRVTGHGPVKVLLLHALTGGPDAADRDGVKGWWAPVFRPGAPFEAEAVTVWTPNLLGSCYGSTGPAELQPFPRITPRDQAEVLADWIRREGVSFDLVLGSSLGGTVAQELAILEPDRFWAVGVAGCGARADAWVWGTTEIQRAILRNPSLKDEDAIALARQAAMLTFRAPTSIDDRFPTGEAIRDWLHFHGQALAQRFTRGAYLAMLDAMDGHDLGRDRGGLVEALKLLKAPLHVLGIDSDQLYPPHVVQELADAAQEAGCLAGLDWIRSPHGHDAFLIEWDQVNAWLARILGGLKP